MEVTCERELGEDGPGTIVLVRLGKPEEVAEGEFRCAFQLQGLGNSQVQYAHGVDGFQALQMAMEGIRNDLEKSGRSFSWQGGEAGDTGFPRAVPAFYGTEFSQRINRLIDEEVERFAREAQERSVQRL